MKIKKCPICSSETMIQLERYDSGKTNPATGRPIVIDDVKIRYCTNAECKHSWLPEEEEERIDLYVERESRFHLSPSEIATARESMDFETKADAANFLCLNSKAFIKWENGYSTPNTAYDLLIRLAMFDRRNMDFIHHMHSTNFRFDESDYQLICEQKSLAWKFRTLVSNDPLEKLYNYSKAHPEKTSRRDVVIRTAYENLGVGSSERPVRFVGAYVSQGRRASIVGYGRQVMYAVGSRQEVS